MCEECITPQPTRKIGLLCGCLTIRQFLPSEEKIEVLGEYRKQLEKETAGVDKTIEEVKRKIK